MLLKNGKRLFLVLGLLLASSCRSSTAPAIEICIGDGFGGADCIRRDGSRLYRPPSELQNYWMTNQDDMRAYSSWCFDTSAKIMDLHMKRLTAEIQ